MKISFPTTKHRGFTLIELIVVIAILAVLASIAVPTLMKVQDDARRTSSRKACTDVVEGVTRFATDNNNMLPYDPEEASADKKGQIYLVTDAGKDASLLAILTARDDHRFNTTGDVYLRADLQEEARDGLYERNGRLGLYDPWGSPYYIVMSEEESGAIDPFTRKELRGKNCLVYGLGPDKEGEATVSTKKVKHPRNEKNKKDEKGGREAKRAAAAAAAEAAAEAVEDNVYSWKKS